MSNLTLTKTHMIDGTWQGIVTGAGDAQPDLAVTHADADVAGIKLVHNAGSDHWVLSIPVPAAAIADGIHTLLVADRTSGTTLASITLIGDEVTGPNLRAEVDLLRAELDMLKRAFRRHCVETS
ncbi:MAG: hypothetical protein KBT62_09535 [Sulfitobacter litoralis]|jgi:hypothetical protein|uniref:Uncharacterized protein n=2 Tax=root TaxID=1 RepID=A0A1H0K131_9RHOB|nr:MULTISPECIES: hypothetical protein [Sulfitobacter]MBQ0717518.1 hypothetical protein [Sulfitobacter litoralis]MBQ0766578.1 hypothetical protein [Sulfitobacter litoralis]MBQ0800954.1 hypothetical protein [Sulfitobacter litoralis]MCF7727568.1 hypothetical protein [Sulfitobacter sp. M22]MCF7778928.1 hypothetical protein [Sulfitobacter sp. M220]|tara:strand:+ start:2445 stop:2816 length:372 start_codon:yes stop_codon:yes gene_type:complete